jgi:hypothetical protein
MEDSLLISFLAVLFSTYQALWRSVVFVPHLSFTFIVLRYY